MRFLLELLGNRSKVGAVVPSSPWLGERLSAVIASAEKRNSEIRVLEVGPGTGAVTRILRRKLRPEDRLTLVELNPFFCRSLERKIERWDKAAESPDIDLYQGSILDYPHKIAVERVDHRYDLIVSSLPFNSFSAELSKRLFYHICSLIKEGGVISYYEYIGVRWVKELLLKSSGRELFAANEFVNLHMPHIRQKESRVFRNLPPAVVRTLYY